jgi:signal transduction histidine kinase
MNFEENPLNLNQTICEIFTYLSWNVRKENRIIKKYWQRYSKNSFGDDIRLRQIFLNLISNAIKFTEKDNHFRHKILDQNAEKTTIEFALTDTGIGFQKTNLTLFW